MPHLTLPRPRPAAPPGAAPATEMDPDGPFWCAAIGSGAALVLELAAHIDAQSHHAAHLPQRPALTRPVVGQYLSTARSLASAWSLHSRPALLAALGALLQFGASLGQPFTVDAMAAPRVDQALAAQRVLDAVRRRLAAPLAAFDTLSHEFAGALAQMARISAELEADTRLVTQRLQADQVHAFLLSQQAGGMHGAALDSMRVQLGQLRAGQAATRAEADYLQGVRPTLAPCLASFERIGAGIDVILAGTRALERQLAQRQHELGAAPDSAARIGAQLQAALPHWQALATAARRLTARSLAPPG